MTRIPNEIRGAAVTGLWPRRAVLRLLAATGVISAAAPGHGLATTYSTSDGLFEVCRAATRGPAARWLGAACPWSDGPTIEAMLRARIPAARTPAEWRAALPRAGREDLARGDIVEVGGARLSLTEALVLALGERLRRPDPDTIA